MQQQHAKAKFYRQMKYKQMPIKLTAMSIKKRNFVDK